MINFSISLEELKDHWDEEGKDTLENSLTLEHIFVLFSNYDTKLRSH